jgi:preprotein translocase subunit SecA
MVPVLGKLSVLWDTNERDIRRMSRRVQGINALEDGMRALSDADLGAKKAEFRGRLERGEALDALLPEAFAAVREAARRTLNMRHFDVQLIGGIVLHEGRIAEMKTGEGKTLVAPLAVYLNALPGTGVHVVTVNDYLARRDAEWMGKIYTFLGLEVGLIVHGLEYSDRRRGYASDVAYGTNNEFGFDYLRDNMVLFPEHLVQRALNYAIVDEVDSILVDEARTPLIISGPGQQSTELYNQFARVVRNLKHDVDYTVDEKAHTVHPTEAGVAKVERLMGLKNLFDDRSMEMSHYLIQALKAQSLMKRDRDYVVKDGQVIIVDEFTGRLMFGRRYSDGLHQAIEAKENVRIEKESQTLATITFQNYFRMYKKLAGMTGTAKTEEEEFNKIYGMDVVVIPTNEPMIRTDHPDVVHKTEAAKFRAVVREICDCYRRGQPVLVGTISIEKSERLSDLLRREGVPHEVLNAKYHEKEAQIIALAGQGKAVTIATNMAGRGTDIVLGAGIPDLGGLHVLGTERHEARRIDNQLRGRSGRQGDQGTSRFYVSLEDDLMRLFGGDIIHSLMDRLGIDEDEPIEHGMIGRAIESAQKRVESRNFDIRKHVLEYDDVMNQHREVIYKQRRRVLGGEDLRQNVLDMVDTLVERIVGLYAHESVHAEDWDAGGLIRHLEDALLPPQRLRPKDLQDLRPQELRERVIEEAHKVYEEREAALGAQVMRELERQVMLRVADTKWIEHLDGMDDLREGIGLRAYGQRDPLLEYKIEAYETFQGMIEAIQEDIVKYVYKLNVVQRPAGELQAAPAGGGGGGGGGAPGSRAAKGKVGRNDPCPCGSGKKYKKCCGQ